VMRAVVAVALLVGVYVLGLALIAGMPAFALLSGLFTIAGTSDDDDRGHLVLALYDHNRFAEAIEQFRALGSRADGAPWSRFEDPKGTFLEYRANSCRKAALKI